MKFYEFNAKSIAENEVEISFHIQGINKQADFVNLFTTGKAVLEQPSMFNFLGFSDYLQILFNFVNFLTGLFKKTK